MEDQLRKILKKTRESSFFSVAQAAHWAGVADRTWRSYESQFPSSNRNLSRRSIWNFFSRSNLTIPVEIKEFIFSEGSTQVISVTNYKGGIGKSPITVDLAACLTLRGFKVAVITSDSVYRGMIARKASPEKDSLVSKIDFFDEKDVVFRKSEIRDLKKRVSNMKKNCEKGGSRRISQILLPELTQELERKESTKTKFEELKANYDYIFLDINREFEKVRDLTNLVILLIDISCFQAINSSELFVEDFRGLFKKKKKNSLLFGLVTKKGTGGQRSVIEDYYGENVHIEENDYKELQEQMEWHRNQRETNLSAVNGLNIPMLKTSLSFAHEEVISTYNRGRLLLRGYSYFDSVLDVAPASYASAEINQLLDELIELRM